MNLTEALAELESLGTAQNRRVYARHGVAEPSYGVSYANLGKLKKRIGVDHDLALKLWKSGNHDARVLATMVADPARLDARTLESWLADVGNYVLTDALSTAAGASPDAKKLMQRWTKAKAEWKAAAGWNVFSRLVSADGVLTDAEVGEHLDAIETRIHGSANRARYAMNTALISLGLRDPTFQALALAAAERIGPVEVDHGETGCKTPDAAAYIAKTAAYRRKKARAKKA